MVLDPRLLLLMELRREMGHPRLFLLTVLNSLEHLILLLAARTIISDFKCVFDLVLLLNSVGDWLFFLLSNTSLGQKL